MTAEIGILNKSAVALAADSAVTIHQKIYNSANKLFELSEHHPVGIMIYGSAEFMGIPWETIIKAYRAELGEQSFPTIQEYCNHFLSFLQDSRWLFPKNRQRQYLQAFIGMHLSEIRKHVDQRVKEAVDDSGKVEETTIRKFWKEEIRKRQKEWSQRQEADNLPEDFSSGVLDHYQNEIKKVENDILVKAPISDSLRAELRKMIGTIAKCGELLGTSSGIVIAGFGSREIYPSVVAKTINGLWFDTLIARTFNAGEISDQHSSIIMPFAQSEMVHTFMQGVDPRYQRMLEVNVGELLSGIPDKVIAAMPDDAELDEDDFKKKMHEASEKMLNYVSDKLKRHRFEKYSSPVLDAVAVLPKDELAEMAESLVNLTSFKRRMSMELETVGGAIDVAVISKGDGFVWIKRKHYFKPELNQRFIARVFQDAKKENN